MDSSVVKRIGHVFPLHPTSYKPVIKWRAGSLKGTDSFPTHNGPFGLDCGKSGLVVLDIDVKNGKDGRLSLAELPGLPATYTVKTKSGGYHYYFKGEGQYGFRAGRRDRHQSGRRIRSHL